MRRKSANAFHGTTKRQQEQDDGEGDRTVYPIGIATTFSTVVGMANSLLAQLGDPNSVTNIGSLVPFFVMVFLAKGFVAATPHRILAWSG